MSEHDQPLPVVECIKSVRTIRDLRATLPLSFTNGFGEGESGVKIVLHILGNLSILAHVSGTARNFPGSRSKRTGSKISEEGFAALVTTNLGSNKLERATSEENKRVIDLCLESGIIERRQPNPEDRFDDPDNVYLLSESMGAALKRIFKPY